MKKLLIFTTFISLAIGIIALSMNLIFGNNTVSFINTEEVGTLTYYKFNFLGYINNIKTTFTDVEQLTLQLPTREWSDIDIGNNLAYMLDMMILVANILLYPIRAGGFIGRCYLSLIGIDIYNTTGGLYWLVSVVNTFTTLQLQYV